LAEAALHRLAEAVLAACRGKGLTLATAESCTGGMVAAALTDIAGSSDVVERGFVTYSNAAKSALLAVPPALIAAHGAVSAEIAAAMAAGALQHAPVDLAIAVTGIAGPGGGTPDKPVGLSYVALSAADGREIRENRWSGTRWENRLAAVAAALELLAAHLGKTRPP